MHELSRASGEALLWLAILGISLAVTIAAIAVFRRLIILTVGVLIRLGKIQ